MERRCRRCRRRSSYMLVGICEAHMHSAEKKGKLDIAKLCKGKIIFDGILSVRLVKYWQMIDIDR